MTDTPTEIDLTKVFRLQAMLQALRSEVHELDADQASLTRLATIHNEIERQLATAIPALEAELAEFSSCCHDKPNPSKAEIRVAQAQLVGWIEGLLRGVYFTMANAQHELPEPAPAEHPDESASYNPNSYL